MARVLEWEEERGRRKGKKKGEERRGVGEVSGSLN